MVKTTLADPDMAQGIVLDDFLPYLLNRIVNRLNMDLAEDLRGIGMTIQQYRVLAVLAARDGRSVNELSVYTVTEQSTLSKSLDRMEQAGLIERRPDPADRRVVTIWITPAGREGFARVLPIAMNHYRRAVARLGEGEHDALVRALHKVLDAVRASPFP